MNRPIVVLRPEPGARATVARIEALGGHALAAPLFAIRPLPWTPPDPADHDALVLTSANAARMAGAGLARVAALPAFASIQQQNPVGNGGVFCVNIGIVSSRVRTY